MVQAWAMVLDGYIRVSQVNGRSGDRFISPQVQRDQIQGYARLHGHQLGVIFEELDQSGGRADRPLRPARLETRRRNRPSALAS